MSWHPIGRGRHASPALALAPEREFWRALLAVADPTQHRTPAVVPTHLLAYPNCHLYSLHAARDSVAALFLFAAPLAAVAELPHLLRHAESLAQSVPTVWRLGAVADNTTYNVCRALQARINLLASMCVDAQSCAWLDAHLLMANALDSLGVAPGDGSPELALILARYAPAHYMALREADLPDLSCELERCNLFVGGVDFHKEDPFIDLFSKALPRSYDTNDLVTKVADSAVRNAGFFAFLRVALAATQLGLYSHARARAPFAVRLAVYRLFFFELDPALRAHARGSPTPGTAAAVRDLFDLSQLVERLTAGVQSTRIEVQYLSYTKSLVHTYESATVGRKAKAVESTEGVVHRSRKKVLHVAVCTHSAPSRQQQQQEQKWSAADRERACAMPVPSTWDGALLCERTSLRVDRATAHLVCSALFTASAMSRLLYERNCGTDVYEQRRASGQLDGDASAAPPAEPFAPIDYASAASTLQLPCDMSGVQGEERLQSDALLFEWLTTSAIQFAAPVDGSGGMRRKKSDFVFQHTLLLAVREYIVFVMRRWCEPLRAAYERMVRWARWETQLLDAADRFRTEVAGCATAAAGEHWPVGELLLDVRPHVALAGYMPTTQFRAHLEPFIGALLHRFALVTRGYTIRVRDEWRDPFDLAPVDAVVPRETELLLRHLLAYWQYPTATQLAAGELLLDEYAQDGDDATHHQPHDFVIEPAPNDSDSVPMVHSEWVPRARFPLGLFHASDESLKRFSAVRVAYAAASSAELAEEQLKAYVEWLASESAFQFQLMYAYCRAVDRHLHVRTFPLPRHIVEHQMHTLRNQNCMPTNAPVQPHLLRGLVCVGCARVATFLPPTEQRQSTMAFGNDEVRVLTTLSDDEYVFDAVRRRKCVPLGYALLRRADSWLTVLHHRARDTPHVYDRYVVGGSGIEPLQTGILTEDEYVRRAQRIFALPPPLESSPLDRRQLAPLVAETEPQTVARGRGRIGELVFADALWQAVDERMAQFGGTADGQSFLLMGHTLPHSDARYSRMRFACKSHHIRSENKKSKLAATTVDDDDDAELDDEEANGKKAAVAGGENSSVDAQRARILTKQCRDAQANALYAACSRELMREVDYLGRAVYFTSLDASKRVVWSADDFVAICCDCLAATRSADLRAIADRVVCKSCYAASRLCSGSVALRMARGESTKTVATAVPNALPSDVLQTVHGAARQALFSPSYAVLCDEVVGTGTVCALDRCKAVKSAETRFYGLEVLCDTDIGNETFGFIYFCATHARLYRALFNATARLPLSTVRYYMADSKRFANNIGMRGNFLENIMRGDARATEHQFRSELAKQIDTKKRGLVQKRRAQRKQAITAGARASQQQERAATDRLLAAD